MNANRKFKDSVFTNLFNNPDLLRELYCALEDVSLPEDIPISINTLEHALVRDVYNDISFIIGSRLVVLIEHQSTINPNMALRFLMYIAESYKQMFRGGKIYSGKKISIPCPLFYVLYNGKAQYPDEKILLLSDFFKKPKTSILPEKASSQLELIVKVLNINEGKNGAILNRCKMLAEYSSFVAKVREYRKKYDDLITAITEAVNYCIEHDILKEYLNKHEAEVINMLYSEWNLDDALEVRYEEGVEEGVSKGKVQGREEVLELLEQGFTIEEIKQRFTAMQSITNNGDKLTFSTS